MATTQKKTPSASDVEEQIRIIREDISNLTKLMSQLGEQKMSDAKSSAKAEAEDLLNRSRKAANEAADAAREKVASVEDYIVEKPIQSAIIALLVGMFLGSLSRR